RRCQHRLAIALIPHDRIGNAQFFEQPQHALRARIFKVMDCDSHESVPLYGAIPALAARRIAVPPNCIYTFQILRDQSSKISQIEISTAAIRLKSLAICRVIWVSPGSVRHLLSCRMNGFCRKKIPDRALTLLLNDLPIYLEYERTCHGNAAVRTRAG